MGSLLLPVSGPPLQPFYSASRQAVTSDLPAWLGRSCRNELLWASHVHAPEMSEWLELTVALTVEHQRSSGRLGARSTRGRSSPELCFL